MLTIFTTPRPFERNFDIIQRNAIQSWIALKPRCQIILFEDEKSTTGKLAEEFGIECISGVAQNGFGTPIFSDVVNKISRIAIYPIIAYVNTDIILLEDFIEAVKKVKNIYKKFLIVGCRRNLDIKENINFEDSGWAENLRKRVLKEGNLHHQAAIDYFVFPRKICPELNLPPFVVGRPYWDGWFLYRVHSLRIPLIDGTSVITSIHQNHYRQYGSKIKKAHSSEKIIEFKKNLELLGGFYHALTLADTNWILTKQGLKRRKIFPWQYFKRYFVLFLGAYPCFDFKSKILLYPLWLGVVAIRDLRKLFLKILK